MKSNTIKTALELLIIAALIVGSFIIGKQTGKSEGNTIKIEQPKVDPSQGV